MTQDLSDSGEETEEGGAGKAISPLEILGFVRGAARRHRLLGLLVFLGVGTVGTAVSLALPALYAAETKILIAQTVVSTNPERTQTAADPLRGASDIVSRKENLEGTVREANLVKSWEETRGAVFKAKDWVMAQVLGPLTEADKVKALVGMLEDSLEIRPEGNVSLGIKVYWRDANTAADLTKILQRRFLDTRLEQDTSVISAAIDILDAEAKKSAEAITPELKEVQRLVQTLGSPSAPEPAPSAAPASGGAPAVGAAAPNVVRVAPIAPAAPAIPDPALVTKLQEVRNNIRSVTEPWQRRISDLTAQLSDLRGVYGPSHPAVIQQEARIKEASAEPPQLTELRQQEQEVMAELRRSTNAGDVAGTPGGAARVFRGGAVRPASALDRGGSLPIRPLEEPPELSAARAKLRSAIDKYTEFTSRVDEARLQLTTARAAFKYRYQVVAEPEVPRKPVKPKRALLIIGSIVGALLFGLVAGAIRELLTGRLLEPWQLKTIGVPLLGEIKFNSRN
jgi:uncharacterized protein involved in exopolysaccharide biosynthesis